MSNDPVTMFFNGCPLAVYPGETVAGALLREGIHVFSTHPVTGQDMAPLCMMGICRECRLEIDGKSDQQACLTAVYDGIVVRPMKTSVAETSSYGN